MDGAQFTSKGPRTTDQVARYRRDGFVVAKAMLDGDLVAQLIERLHDLQGEGGVVGALGTGDGGVELDAEVPEARFRFIPENAPPEGVVGIDAVDFRTGGGYSRKQGEGQKGRGKDRVQGGFRIH
jgi:hypothetical protein